MSPVISVSHRRRVMKRAAFAGTMLLLGGASSGMFAYRHWFQRTGELAANAIPADALVVVTLDTSPSPAQVPLFKRLEDEWKAAGLNTKFDEMSSEMMDKSPVIAEMRPFTTNHFAFALFPDPVKKDDVQAAVFVALSDTVGAAGVLKKEGAAKTTGSLTYYVMQKGSTDAAVIGNYLVLSDKSDVLARVQAVSAGKAGSIAALPDFAEARKGVAEDASFMAFVSPAAYKKMMNEAAKQGGASTAYLADMYKGIGWVSMGASVRETGLAFDYRVPMDASQQPMYQEMAKIAPLDSSLLKKLPAGAYSVSSFSQPGQYWQIIKETFSKDPKMKKDMDSGVADFEKHSGLSVAKDIVPGLNGAVTMAIYPDEGNPDGVMDGLFVVSDANGAAPAALADKVRMAIAKASADDKDKPVGFVSSADGGVTRWTLDPHSEKEFRLGLSDSPAPTPASVKRITPRRKRKYGSQSAKSRTRKRVVPQTIAARPISSYAKDKTITWAQIGQTVLIATSREMLNKAVAAYQGQGTSLADDAAYADIEKSFTPGSQVTMAVSVGHIMARLKPEIEKSLKDDSTDMVSDILSLFGSENAGIAASARYDGKVSTGSFFLPLDYDRLISLISKGVKKSQENHPEITRRD